MSGAETIVSVAALTASQILALRGFRSRRLGLGRTAAVGLAWAVIIAGLAYVLQRYQP